MSKIEDLISSNEVDDVIITDPISEKSVRTQVHQLLKKCFDSSKIVSDTFHDSIRISCAKSKKQKLDSRNYLEGKNMRKKKSLTPFLKFVLEKRNMDTMDAVQFIARRLHVSPKMISYAGTKDRRAVTRQWLVIGPWILPEKVAGINKLAVGKIAVSGIVPCTAPLRFGDHGGNHFTLILRNIKGKREQIDAAMKSLCKNGFINYFGLQRFGTTSIGTHQIGISLLKGDWQEAIRLILRPREDETDLSARSARKEWEETGDAAAALAMFPHKCTSERQILQHFVKVGGNTDLLGAIQSISREMRLMYLHSVQSLLWNHLVSQIVLQQRHGDAVNMLETQIPIPGHTNMEDLSVLDMYRETMDKFGIEPCQFRSSSK